MGVIFNIIKLTLSYKESQSLMPLSRFEDINVVMSPAEIVVKEKLVRSSQEAARAKRSHRSSQSQKQPAP